MGTRAGEAGGARGQIVIRTMLPLTLAFDHRVADGADAARFVDRDDARSSPIPESCAAGKT